MTTEIDEAVDDFFGDEHQAPPAGVATTWAPVDLGPVLSGDYEAPKPTIGQRDDGAGMLYPGREHSIFAEPEGMKTWLALVLGHGEMNRGNGVVFIDFEDGPAGIVSRLLALGASPDLIRDRFRYIRPEGPMGQVGEDHIKALLAPPCTLVILDGVTEAMSLFDLDPKADTDVARFGRMLPKFITAHGPAVLSLDHVVKDRESRGRWATGSQHKLSGLNGVAYTLESVTPLAPGQTGKSRIRVSKDRPGEVRRNALPGSNGALAWFADFVVESQPDGSALAYIKPPIAHEGPFRPTAVMKKVADAIAGARGPLNVREIEARVGGKKAVTAAAVARLIDEGFVDVADGPNRAKLHTLAKPFEEVPK